MDTPTPTPVAKEIDFQMEAEPYWINLSSYQNEIHILIRRNGLLPRKRFQADLKIDDLLKKSKWFKMFDSSLELAVELVAFLKTNKYNIKEETNFISLTFKIELTYQSEFEIILSEINTVNEDILLDICNSMNEMKVSLTSLTQKCEFLESTYEYKKLIERGKAVTTGNILLNEKDKKMLSNWISNDDKGLVTYQLLYKATIDGDEGHSFHQHCDYKGPTITILKTTKNYVFGGYTSLSWNKSGSYQKDPKAFLFSIDLQKIYPIKVLDYSILGKDACGPIFGGNTYYDIYILSNFLSINLNQCHLSTYGAGVFFEFNGKEQYFGVKELEVYQVIIDH